MLNRFKAASDDELVLAIGNNGSEAAFRELYDRHKNMLLGYTTRLLGSRDPANDVAQETWIRVVKMAPQYDGQNKFRAWLCTIARNLALTELKRKNRFEALENEDGEIAHDLQSPSFEQDLFEQKDGERLNGAIDQLPDQQRLVLICYLFEDKNYEEVAEQLDLSLSSVKSLLFRARENLKKQLGARV